MTTESKSSDISWGLRWGLGFASFYSLVAVAIGALYPEALASNAVELGPLVVTYFFAGIAGGAVIGVLRPLTRNSRTAYIPAFLASWIAVSAVAVLVEGPPSLWRGAEWRGTIVLAAIFAAAGVQIFRSGEGL